MTDIKKIENRNSTLDIIRIVSVALVMSVHFFLYTGFYSEPTKGLIMFLMCVMRTFFSACVPMFILLSGYLMSSKKVSKKYYFGLSKTLITYVLASVACIFYNTVFLKSSFNFSKVILSFFDFSAAQYGWYIEMYIGLFLLIPFLNIIYNKLESQKHKQMLVLTMVVLTAVPTLFNIYNLDNPAWWGNPPSSDKFNALLPDWWIGFYPVTFYFTGCYLREYGLKLKTRTIALLLVLTTVAFGAFNFWRSYGVGFKTGLYAYWYGFQPYVTSVLLFELLNRIKCDNMSYKTKFVLWKVSDLVLCMYLVSYIFDSFIYYKVLNKKVPVMTDRIKWFIFTVLFVFVCSLILAFILHLIEKAIKFIYSWIVDFIKELRTANKQNVVDLCFVLLFVSAVIFAIWKAPLGFGGNDEAFYLTVPHRLGLGDALFRDEWHLSQMSGFITMPFVWLYRTIVGSTDGIILAARYTYIVLHGLVSVFAYIRLRKHGYLAAIATVSYFVFTPYNIMALSYNTMALDFLLLSGILLATSKPEKRLHFMLSGLCLAAAVLCCPYLAAGYVLYALGVIIHVALKKKGITKSALCHNIFSPSTFIWFTSGVCILALLFVIFIATTGGLDAIFKNLPLMLTDPEHPQIGFIAKLKGYFKYFIECHPRFNIAFYSYVAMLVAMLVDKNRKNHRAFYLIISGIIMIVCLLMFYPKLTTNYYNAIMMPMIFVGLTSYVLCENKPKALFCTVFLGGLLYSFAVTMSSNQYFYVAAMACAITNVSSFIFLSQVLKEMKERPDEVAYGNWLRRSAIGVAAFAIAILGFMQVNAKANHCFWETSVKTLKYQMTSGPAKGIYTTSATKSVYEDIDKDLEYYKDVPKGNILMLTERTWCYLAVDDMPYGSFSAWISGENQTALNRLEDFYEVNPDKIPDYIYIPKVSNLNKSLICSKAQRNGYTLIENETSYKLNRK